MSIDGTKRFARPHKNHLIWVDLFDACDPTPRFCSVVYYWRRHAPRYLRACAVRDNSDAVVVVHVWCEKASALFFWRRRQCE